MDEVERVHQLLTIAAEPPGPPVTEPGPELVRRARGRRRARQKAGLVAAVLAVAAVAAPLALIDFRRSPAPVVPAAALPREFGVAAPVQGFRSGSLRQQARRCGAGEVTGDAHLVPSTYGVLGVARLHGSGCSIDPNAASITLLDSAGRPLGVPVVSEANPNPGGVFPAIQGGSTDLAVGFAWRGSWCGSPARQLRVDALTAGAGQRAVAVPITGSSPACRRGSSGYVAPGLVGRENYPVQPPPPAWRALRAAVELPATARPDEVVSYRVVLKNTGDRPVTLTPCPNYSMLVAGSVLASSQGAAGLLESASNGKLPCGEVLPPGGSVQVPLVLSGSSGPYRGVVRVEWAMAGVPTARGQVRIR